MLEKKTEGKRKAEETEGTEDYNDLEQKIFSLYARGLKEEYYNESGKSLKDGNVLLGHYFLTIAEFYEFLEQEYYSSNINPNVFFNTIEENVLLYFYGFITEIENTYAFLNENYDGLEATIHYETARLFLIDLNSIEKKLEGKKEYESLLKMFIFLKNYYVQQLETLNLFLLIKLNNSDKKNVRDFSKDYDVFKKRYPLNNNETEKDELRMLALSVIIEEAKHNEIYNVKLAYKKYFRGEHSHF